MHKRRGVAWRNPASGILRSRTVFRTCDRIPTFPGKLFLTLFLCSERKECQWKADAPKWIQNGTKMAREEGGGTEEEHSLRSNSRLSREANSIWHCARSLESRQKNKKDFAKALGEGTNSVGRQKWKTWGARFFNSYRFPISSKSCQQNNFWKLTSRTGKKWGCFWEAFFYSMMILRIVIMYHK